MDRTGLTKLIYSSSFDSTVDVGMNIIEDPALLTKSASTIFDCDYDEIKPDKDHVGIHLVGLGDYEHYGSNRNGDGFPKKACIEYHHTFEKSAHLYRHHRNKDPKKSLGNVVKSAYNEPMGRIEVFVHAHKEKARDELEKLAKDGTIPFSMACRVPYDRCSRCGTLRKSARDDSQCDHVKHNLGKMAEDGKITCTLNDTPNFFDMSFVGRPADRIAWDLKIASGDIVDSVKLAEAAHLWVPDHIAISSVTATEKHALLKKLAASEAIYVKLAESRAGMSPSERYVWELRKAADVKLDGDMLDNMRDYDPQDIFYSLAKAGAVMDIESFYKYALGPRYSEVSPYIGEAKTASPTMFTDLMDKSECQLACNVNTFDVDAVNLSSLDHVVKSAHAASFTSGELDQRVIDATISNKTVDIGLDSNVKIASNRLTIVDGLVTKYAAYKLSAVKAIEDLHTGIDINTLHAIAVAQNFVNRD